MDHDDVLPAHALYMVALEILQHSDADLIYSDEDYLDEKGRRQNPHFKPDWNQELFYSQNYINHLGVYRTSLVRKLAECRQGFEGSQDYDLALRVIASTSPDRIRHIPHVLYHWRWAGKVDTFATANLQTAVEAAHRALRDYFRNLGRAVGVNSGATTVFNRVIREAPDPLPRVSVIIPTRDLVGLLRTCVDGLLTKTDYQNLEVVIVDNGSTDPAAVRYLEELDKSQQVTVVRIDVPFNHSMLCNSGVEHASGDLLLFLNNDIEVIEPGWLKEMVAQVVEPGVGAVGAKLYYRDDTIQHSGVVLGIGGTAGHGHRHMPRSHGGYACRLQLVQDVSCATAACLIMPRYVFEEAGRFDAEEFRVSYNDVDLCVRICRAGYRIVWTPYAELYHLEAASRGYDHEPRNAARALSEVRELRRRWSSVLTHDPMYSPNLTLRDESYGFAFPPRSLKPWLTWKTSRSREEAAQRPALESARSTIRPQERNTKNVDFRELPERIALGVSRQGNFFMTEIARILEDAFGKLGTRARIFTEAEAAAVSRDEAVLIVAPHEFFHLGEGPIAYELLRRHPYLLMLNTEQLQTTWFTVAEKYLQDATAVLDINHHSAVELSQRGFRSAALPIGYSGYIAASFDGKNLPDNQLFAHLSAREKNHLPGSYAERPIDILFVGTTSDRRSRYFAQNAAYFAGKHSFIYLPNGNRPFLRDDRRTIEFSTYAALARRSKILLTIHRDDAPYLESQRVVTLGIMQKTLVVAEQSEPLPHLVPNRDYLQGDLQCLTSLCNVALDNPDMMSEIAEKSYALLKRDCSMEDFIVKCWRHLAEQSRESESWRQTIAAGN
jgi:GT2 family glycosyltransferase